MAFIVKWFTDFFYWICPPIRQQTEQDPYFSEQNGYTSFPPPPANSDNPDEIVITRALPSDPKLCNIDDTSTTDSTIGAVAYSASCGDIAPNIDIWFEDISIWDNPSTDEPDPGRNIWYHEDGIDI